MPVTTFLIDDSPDVSAVLREALTPEGYDVLEAADGTAGVRVYREHRPALVLLNLIIPEGHGIETFRMILSSEPVQVGFTSSGKADVGDNNEAAMAIGANRGFATLVRVGRPFEACSCGLRCAWRDSV